MVSSIGWILPSGSSDERSRGAPPGRRLLRQHLLFRFVGALGEEAAGDDLAVDLARPLPDLVYLHLPPVARDGARLHEPLAAVDLDRLIRGPLGRLRRKDLGYARLAGEAAAPVPEPRGLQHHVARELHLHRHVGELELYGLELGDGLAKLPALPCALQRLVQARLREPDRERGDRHASPVERLQELPEPLAALAEQVLFRHPAILEVERALVGGAPARLLVAGP